MVRQTPDRLNPWWVPERGDIDVTIAQLGFNLAQMVIPVFLLLPLGVSLDFGVTHFLPGYALGFLVGSFGFTFLAVRLRKRENRADVAAHAYGNNVPAILAYTLTIMLPVYLQSHDIARSWQIGAAAVIWTGIIKLAAVPFAALIRRVIPVPASMAVFGAAMYSYLGLALLQRLFDQPVVGLVALSIVAVCVLGNVPITRWRIPPFLVSWLVPLLVGFGIGYVHPVWHGFASQAPFAGSRGALQAMGLALPYMSVIAPMAIYQILQDVAAVEGAVAAGDSYDARSVILWDGIGTLVCGVAGSVVTPIVYALHPPYKAMGARISYAFWTPVIFILVMISGLTVFIMQLFPWPILAAMIAYVSVGVGAATLRRVDRKYVSVLLLSFILPAGAIVYTALNSALPALKLSAESSAVQSALNGSVYWSSLKGLGSGFLFLVLVVAAVITEVIDRNFGRAAIWCVIAAVFSWVGLMHSAVLRWGAQPSYATGWLCAAAFVYSVRWWRGDSPPVSVGPPSLRDAVSDTSLGVAASESVAAAPSKLRT
jgi:AGZA family xanthine/uracil permease-like MFS transporter